MSTGRARRVHASKTIGDNVVDISRFFPEMACKGPHREITPFIEAEKFDLGQYYPAAVENGKFDGKQYCLPETYPYQAMLIYYNKDLSTPPASSTRTRSTRRSTAWSTARSS